MINMLIYCFNVSSRQDYIFRGQLGRGDFGNVYKATAIEAKKGLEKNEVVAVKAMVKYFGCPGLIMRRDSVRCLDDAWVTIRDWSRGTNWKEEAIIIKFDTIRNAHEGLMSHCSLHHVMYDDGAEDSIHDQ